MLRIRTTSQRWAAVCGVLVLVTVLFAGHCESGKGILIQNIYVAQELADPTTGNVEVFPLTATGNVAPAATIAGASTNIEDGHRIAFDASGNLYVTSKTNSSVLVFAAGASGDVAPISTISGSNTGLAEPTGIAIDATGKIYVADYGPLDPGGPSVFIFAAGANGNVAPVATITGAATGLVFPNGLALDSAGKIYVANEGTGEVTGGSVTVYAAGATGNAPPLATISGSATLLNYPHGLTLDAAGNIYVAGEPVGVGAPAGAAGPGPSGSVLVFAAGSTGNVPPKTTITGSSTLLVHPNGISLDALGDIYVADNAGAVLVFAAGATGNVAPISNISGANTGFTDLHGLTVH